MADRHFDVKRLVSDLGGAATVAANVGVVRTAPYRWMRTGRLSGAAIAAILRWTHAAGLPFDITKYRL